MHDLFCQAVSESLSRDAESSLLKEQVRFTLRNLRDATFDLRDRAPDLLVQTKDISFQDMQSIGRALKDCLGVTVERTELVNNIISRSVAVMSLYTAGPLPMFVSCVKLRRQTHAR